MNHELCSDCIQKGLKECWLKTRINDRINALPPSENQTPIVEDSKITKEASDVNVENAKDRIIARAKGCPPSNLNYNPQHKNFQPNL